MSDFGDWYKSVPFFTRYWMSGTVAFTLLGRFGILNPLNLILLLEPLKRFQIWRPLTAALYFPLSPSTGFHYLINLYFLYTYSRRLEEGVYAGRPADYCYLLIFNWLTCVIIGLLFEMPLLLDPMVLSVLYVWCQLNKDTIVTFWFGTRFKAMYLPWVLLAFNLVLSGSAVQELVGILVGHLYFFLVFKYPQELGGASLLQTPSFLKQWFPNQVGGVHGFGVPPQRQPAARAPAGGGGGIFGGHNWGRGHVLNGNN